MADKITPYQRALRPVTPESFPQYVDQELQKIATLTTHIVEALQALDARIAALEAP